MHPPRTPAEESLHVYRGTGDRDALERALAACAPPAHALARRILGNDADADDAMQDALVRLARDAQRWDGSVPLGAWLGRLVQLAARDALRARRRRRTVASPPPTAATERHVEHAAAEAVRHAVRDLPPRYRATVELHYFAGLSTEDTAAALGLSANAVGVRLHRARERLRRRLAALGGAAAAVAIEATLARVPAGAVAPARAGSAVATALAAPAKGTLAVMAGALAAHPALVAAVVAIALAGAAGGTWRARASDGGETLPDDASVLWRADLDATGWTGTRGAEGIAATPVAEEPAFIEVRSPWSDAGWPVRSRTYLRFHARARDLSPTQRLKVMAKRGDLTNRGGYALQEPGDAARWYTVEVDRGFPRIAAPHDDPAPGETLHQVVWLLRADPEAPRARFVIDRAVLFTTAATLPATPVSIDY